MIGSSEDNVVNDVAPPTIKLYMDDFTFVNGGITGSNTRIVARLFDESGINISGYGIGNSLITTLDDDETYVLNDYYEADLDDYTNGTLDFTLSDVKPGRHTITLRVWDTHNNPAQAKVDFVVTDGNALAIEEFANHPNPFNTSTNLFFTHNQAGNDLEASLIIYDYTGSTLRNYNFSIPESTHQVNLLELTREDAINKNLTSGLYFARLIVRSLADGSKNERVTKLIIAN